MASPADRRARLLEAVYRTWGEPAGWISATGDILTGITVRRVSEEDVPVDFGAGSRAKVERVVLCVRRNEVGSPAKGDRVEILDAAGDVDAIYFVTDRPQRVRFGQEWRVEVKAG